MTEGEFSSDLRVGNAATIQLEGEALITESAGDVRLRQLELIGEGEDWDENGLTLWLDGELHRGDSFRGLPHREIQPWLRRVVDGLVRVRKLSLPMIVRRRHSLAELLRVKVSDHGRQQVREAMRRLIKDEPDAVETSSEFAITIEEQDYCPLHEFLGHRFNKHAFQQVGAMNGEEAECASRIDSHPNVARWLRNLDRPTQGGFGLPLSPRHFYPDFIVELKDRTLVLVEYKMKKMSSDSEELHKKAVGELYEARSAGNARFGWIVDKDWQALEDVLRP